MQVFYIHSCMYICVYVCLCYMYTYRSQRTTCHNCFSTFYYVKARNQTQIITPSDLYRQKTHIYKNKMKKTKPPQAAAHLRALCLSQLKC